MKLYRREEIVRALGLETRRRSELALLLILERLQSETLAGEQRSAVLKDLIGQYAEVLRIRSGLRPSRTQRGFQGLVYRQEEIWLGMLRTKDEIVHGLDSVLNMLDKVDIEEIRRQLTNLRDDTRSLESNEQRQRAQAPRATKPFNELIKKILTAEPTIKLTKAQVLERLEANIGRGVIDEVTDEEIILTPTERSSAHRSTTRHYQSVKIKNLSVAISRVRKSI